MVNKEDGTESDEEIMIRRVDKENLDEYNIIFRETFEDNDNNHNVSSTNDTDTQHTVCGI